jgi:hypothetical protein
MANGSLLLDRSGSLLGCGAMGRAVEVSGGTAELACTFPWILLRGFKLQLLGISKSDLGL